MILIFWVSLIILFYIYIGYPVILNLLPKNRIKTSELATFPSITVFIPAYNEESVIEETILNKLAQDYPKDKVKVIVISDESEDQTDAIVTRLSETHPNIELIRQIPRRGKTSGLNLAFEKIDS